MDLITVRDIRVPRSREELRLAPGDRLLGGGTWLFSEPQTDVDTLVDLTRMGWEPLTVTDAGLTVAATCTIATLAAIPARDGWKAHPLFAQCANALLASFKIWNVATVGGNIALGLPAGAMIALASALDATAELWGPDGADRSVPAAEFITGVRETALMPGELLRAIRFPFAALRARTGFRRIALSPLGRTGTLVIARVDEDGSAAFTITGGTVRPRVLRFSALPTASELATAVGGIDDWYDDPHGSPDWRHALSTRFAEELRVELGSAA